MLPWMLIASALVPGDGAEMRLYRRGDEYSIRVGNYELMNSRLSSSEVALADAVAERLGGLAHAQILIGGLGMGYTAGAMLARAARDSSVVVAELVPAVVEWNRGPLAPLAGHPLSDPRLTIREGDVMDVIRSAQNAWDAILLDVDNGPAGLTSKTNDRLYNVTGLRAAATALRPGGILAIWSAAPDTAFTRRLQNASFSTEELRVRGRGNAGGPRYHIWIAKRRVDRNR